MKLETYNYLPKTTRHARPHIAVSMWVVSANTQFATVSFFPRLFFLFLRLVRRSHQPTDLHQNLQVSAVSAKEVPFGGLDDDQSRLGVQTPMENRQPKGSLCSKVRFSKIQDGGRPPSWISILGHNFGVDQHFCAKFGTVMENWQSKGSQYSKIRF